MGFSRATSPEPTPPPDELTARMVGIGMSFAAMADAAADIENTLLHASVLGLDDGDLRVLAVLTTWLGVHHTHVNADRLVRIVSAHPSERVRAYWASMAHCSRLTTGPHGERSYSALYGEAFSPSAGAGRRSASSRDRRDRFRVHRFSTQC